MGTRLCLAVTCHDPLGSFARGVSSADALWPMFSAVAVSATEETHQRTFDAIASRVPDALVSRHRAGSIGIGTARRAALDLALSTDCTHVLYSDLDHVLRWADVDPDELRSATAPDPQIDFTVVGRSPQAFAREPARLRETESVVNTTAALAVGSPELDWDFMMAIRIMTREAASEVAARCLEETIGNDVAWPLHLRQAGLRVGFRSVDALAYRHRDDFHAVRDDRDADPREWVTRIEIAALHATAMRPYLDVAQRT